jgi:hypothetical protein
MATLWLNECPGVNRGVMAAMRLAASIGLIMCGSIAAPAGERHAGLSAYDIFSNAAPRPPRSVPHAGADAKVDRPASAFSASNAASKPLRPAAASAPNRAPIAVHPSAAMFPPVAPLD